MKVYKTITLPIKTTKNNIDYFYQCNQESAKVWNECLRLNKYLWEKDEKYVDRKYLQDNIKSNFSNIIPAKCMQITIKRYMSAISGIQKARKAGRNDLKYPWKQKKNYNTIWDAQMLQINYDKNTIRLPRPKYFNKLDNRGKIKSNPIYLKVKSLPLNIIQIELVYNNELKLAINYYEEIDTIKIQSNNICAVDLGEIHTITAIDNNGNPLIVTGREYRSIQRFRNKELGKLNNKLSKCTKGSNNYKKYRKAIRKLLSKANAKKKDFLHKTSKLFVDYVIMNNIKTVVFGDLKQYNMNLNNINSKKGRQQKLVQWNHGEIIHYIKYKLEPFGVEFVEISERYTSQTCPKCGQRHKPTNRNYECSCGFKMHRDIVGAYNILSKYQNNGKIISMDIDVKPTKYLRIA